MNKDYFIEALYQSILEDNEHNQKLDPHEYDCRFNRFADTYLPAFETYGDKRSKAEEELTVLIFDYIRNAFRVGFDTALELMK